MFSTSYVLYSLNYNEIPRLSPRTLLTERYDCSIDPHRLFGVFRTRLLPVSRHRSQNRESEHETGKFAVN